MKFSEEHLNGITTDFSCHTKFKRRFIYELDSGYISLIPFDFYSLPSPFFPRDFLPMSNSLWMSFLYSENLKRTAISYLDNFHIIFSDEQIRHGNLYAVAGSKKGEIFMKKKWHRQGDIYTISIFDSFNLFSRLPAC